MLVHNLIVINYPKPTSGANALTKGSSEVDEYSVHSFSRSTNRWIYQTVVVS
jgi:hypothetical protein